MQVPGPVAGQVPGGQERPPDQQAVTATRMQDGAAAIRSYFMSHRRPPFCCWAASTARRSAVRADPVFRPTWGARRGGDPRHRSPAGWRPAGRARSATRARNRAVLVAPPRGPLPPAARDGRARGRRGRRAWRSRRCRGARRPAVVGDLAAGRAARRPGATGHSSSTQARNPCQRGPRGQAQPQQPQQPARRATARRVIPRRPARRLGVLVAGDRPRCGRRRSACRWPARRRPGASPRPPGPASPARPRSRS